MLPIMATGSRVCNGSTSATSVRQAFLPDFFCVRLESLTYIDVSATDGILLRRCGDDTQEGDCQQMPEISRFYGIVIAMFYNEHSPPHFHARYGRDQVAIDIRTLEVLEGRIPPRALGLVMEWAAGHERELMECWEQARNGTPPDAINPL